MARPTSVTRRSFLLSSGALFLASQLRAEKFNRRPIGVQLYTVRNVLSEDPRGTLETISEIGYQEVEVLSAHMLQLRPLLDELGLKPTSGHFEAPLVTGNWEAWKPVLPERDPAYTWETATERARQYGLKYIVISYLLPHERGGPDFYRKFADQMNRAGEVARSRGLQLCYHNHAFEFAEAEGERPIDILLSEFDPQLVQFELDVFWAAVAGHDPARFIREHATSISLLHLKDVAPDVKSQYSEAIAPGAFKEVGGGRLDFKAILRAGQEAGVAHYFVEQDQTPGDPLASLRKSYEFLSSIEI